MVRIGVVGAGVVGLTTATFLQEALPEASVVILADRFLQDTVSDGAAGIFRPGLQFQGPTPEITRKWLKDSYTYYKNILDSDKAAEAGVKSLSGYALSSKHPNIVKNSLLEPLVDEFRPCTKAELELHNMKYGSFVTTLLTECRRYQPYLTNIFKRRGGRIIQRKITSFEELADDFDIVCNCSGIGAKELCGDMTVTPIRGQVFKVRAPWIKNFFYTDYDTYILPGFDLITVGGTRQFDSYNDELCPHDAAAIWERAIAILPSLKEGEIVRQWVGLRPYRPMVRVEKEIMTFNNGKKLKVVHNYGHGGYGVMSSPGTSMHAVALVKELLQPKSLL
ncbi:hypothetical protein SK128_019903 [Halocaridina rubra]|uniref:FAD dependent oxidoreductase domain-containing protein n=1 Tax=Halocaridina rubra TaxID=373956 RepID=A0AAN9A5A4_HALRR